MIHIFDSLHLGRPGIIAVTALETIDGIVLFDTGADSTFGNIAAAMRTAGFTPNDVATSSSATSTSITREPRGVSPSWVRRFMFTREVRAI